MIAAIYARKSTEQTGVADEQKSVARQVEHARTYAERKGWTVDDACVFIDDGISGADFHTRPGLIRLINALKPRPPFQVVVMMDDSRLGRDMIPTMGTLQKIIDAGVRVFFYLEDREPTLDGPLEQIMQALHSFGSAMQREQARVHTRDAMLRKARAGHVTGGSVFGYRNVAVFAADGRREHVTREILEEEAVVVRRIFRMCADGHGLTTIAKTLNEQGARCPRSQQGRPKGWAPSTVREVLYRELYRGMIIWNKTITRKVRGKYCQVPQPSSEWLHVPAPQLRIVSDDQWDAVHERLASGRDRYLRLNNGRVLGRPPAVGTKYLLSGLLSCGVCGSSLEARTRSHGRARVPFYGCAAHHRKGSSICANNLEMPMVDADNAVLSTVEHVMLDAGVVDEIITRAVAELQVDAVAGKREALERDRDQLDAELARLTEALAAGGELATVLSGIRTRETQRAQLQRAIEDLTRPLGRLPDIRALRLQVEARVRDWRGLLRKHPEQGSQLLRRLIVGRLKVFPENDADGRYYRFRGEGTLSRLLGGSGPQNVASPRANFFLRPVVLEGIMRRRLAA